MLDVLLLDQPEQLKALGHPLRLRILETLGTNGEDEALTNRELAARLGVDPGHLHFHVRMLLRGLTSDLREAMLGEVQRGWYEHSAEGTFRSAQVTARIRPERALELVTELVEAVRQAEEEDADPLVITAVLHPPSRQETGGAARS